LEKAIFENGKVISLDDYKTMGEINMTWEKQEGGSYWIPEKAGEELVGEVIEIKEGEYGKVYLLKKDDGKKITTPSHKVLQSRMVGTEKGDVLKIVFVGEEPPKLKGHSPTKMYEVYKDK